MARLKMEWEGLLVFEEEERDGEVVQKVILQIADNYHTKVNLLDEIKKFNMKEINVKFSELKKVEEEK